MSRSLAVSRRLSKLSWASAAASARMLAIVVQSAMIIGSSLNSFAAAEPADIETRIGAPQTDATTEASAGTRAQAIAQAPPLAGKIQVEASTDLSKGVVGQQILLRVLVMGDGPLPPGRLIQPSIDDAELLLLSEDRRIDHNASTPRQRQQ